MHIPRDETDLRAGIFGALDDHMLVRLTGRHRKEWVLFQFFLRIGDAVASYQREFL